MQRLYHAIYRLADIVRASPYVMPMGGVPPLRGRPYRLKASGHGSGDSAA